jgi:zinc and cadmium transporter
MLTSTFAAVMLASSLSGVVTALGIFAVSRYRQIADRYSTYVMSFAAGVLISVSFMHIIPESLEADAASPVFLLAGFLAMHLTNRVLNVFLCHDEACTDYTIGILPALGIGVHSFVDGLIYAVTFNVAIFTGILAAVGMILHEFPEGIVTYVLMERAGFRRNRSILYAFLVAALSTPLGTLVAFPFVSSLGPSTLGRLLALSAGALIYVGATHLLPAVERENKRYTAVALAAGVLVALGIVLSKGEL